MVFICTTLQLPNCSTQMDSISPTHKTFMDHRFLVPTVFNQKKVGQRYRRTKDHMTWELRPLGSDRVSSPQ